MAKRKKNKTNGVVKHILAAAPLRVWGARLSLSDTLRALTPEKLADRLVGQVITVTQSNEKTFQMRITHIAQPAQRGTLSALEVAVGGIRLEEPKDELAELRKIFPGHSDARLRRLQRDMGAESADDDEDDVEDDVEDDEDDVEDDEDDVEDDEDDEDDEN